MTAIRLGIIGATGKMGQAVMNHALTDPRFILCSTICSAHSKKLGQVSNERLGLIYKSYHDKEVDVVIDFSTPDGLKQALFFKKPLVCGTTGLSEKEHQSLNELSKEVPVLYSPNFSLGMALCFDIIERLKKKIENFSHISISEKHPKDKRDAPSGTALHIAKILNVPSTQISFERSNETFFQHQIEFFLNQEKVHLRHETASRDAFALGSLSAAKFLFNKTAGIYHLKDLWQ